MFKCYISVEEVLMLIHLYLKPVSAGPHAFDYLNKNGVIWLFCEFFNWQVV